MKTTPTDLITLDEALQLVGMTASGWRFTRNTGRAPEVHVYKVGRRVLFSRAQIEKWLARRIHRVA
jgi:predicted DNA-binding transcriptional regulator AlpA